MNIPETLTWAETWVIPSPVWRWWQTGLFLGSAALVSSFEGSRQQNSHKSGTAGSVWTGEMDLDACSWKTERICACSLPRPPSSQPKPCNYQHRPHNYHPRPHNYPPRPHPDLPEVGKMLIPTPNALPPPHGHPWTGIFQHSRQQQHH